MKYYLKKCWPTVTFDLHLYGCCLWFAGLHQSGVQIQITQGLLDGDLRAHHSDPSSSADLAGRGRFADCRDLLPGRAVRG